MAAVLAAALTGAGKQGDAAGDGDREPDDRLDGVPDE